MQVPTKNTAREGAGTMRDMTAGPAHAHLWRYALPLLIGNWLQLAYNAVDSIIAGR